MQEAPLPFKVLDETSALLYLAVPRSQVVLLQVFFELYDGVATVRTVSGPNQTGQAKEAMVCVLTTPTTMTTCQDVLFAVQKQVSWRVSMCDNDPFILATL